jgi:hypothetical protein
MNPSKARLLAMRRQLLVLESSIQRLQWQRDVHTLRQTSAPKALLAAWRQRQGRVASALEAVVLPLLRASAARSPRIQVLAALVLAWRLVRTWRERQS